MINAECHCDDPACGGECLGAFECPHCGDGDALRQGESCAYCDCVIDIPVDDRKALGDLVAGVEAALRHLNVHHDAGLWEEQMNVQAARTVLSRVRT